MTNKVYGIAGFIFGLTLGYLAAGAYTKHQYEKILRREIESVKKVFKAPDGNKTSEDTEKASYEKVAENLGYSCDFKNKNDKKTDYPYIITPEEFGNMDDYETIGLTYYSDGVVADENDEIVDNHEEIIGTDALDSFGQYEEDAVFVRNDTRRTDYEILKDYRAYKDHLRENPYLSEE